MADYFVRFTHLDRLESELERGYSFSDYVLMDTPEDVADHFGLEEGAYEVGEYGDNPDYYLAQGVTPILPADPEQTLFGVALRGLAGFGPFDTVEEAEDFRGQGMYILTPDADEDYVRVIFEGEERPDHRCFEGTTFRPIQIVGVLQC